MIASVFSAVFLPTQVLIVDHVTDLILVLPGSVGAKYGRILQPIIACHGRRLLIIAMTYTGTDKMTGACQQLVN